MMTAEPDRMNGIPRLLVLGMLVGLGACSSLPQSEDGRGLANTEDGPGFAEFLHRGKTYRLEVAVKHSESTDAGVAIVRINAEGRVLGWNPKSGQYDIDPMGWVCRADKVFGVSSYNTDQLQLSERAGGEGGGTSGLRNKSLRMHRIDLVPAAGETGRGSMDVTAHVRCDLVSADEFEGGQQRVLKSVRVPLAWHIAIDPSAPGGIRAEFRSDELSVDDEPELLGH